MRLKFRRKKEITVPKRYKPKFNRGLTLYQANKRESEGYINKKSVKTSKSYKEIFRDNLVSFFNILLFVIGAILIAFGLWSSCVFLVILLANITIGLIQDIRSKKIIDKLSLLNKETISVVRDGKEIKIDPEELVLDDIVILKKENQIPCDSIVVYGECHVNESLVTGESIPLKKIEGSYLLSGTYVTNGRVYAQVDKVGKDNYIEQLQAKSKDKKAPKSKMYNTLNKLFKVIASFVIVLGFSEILQTVLLTYQEELGIYEWLRDDVLRQVSGALISMIPSGMYLLTSVSLAAGVIALFKQKVAVQDMYSIETIARIDTLCIDKTGTITDGTMSVFNYEILAKDVNNARFEAIISSFNNAVNDENFTALALKEKFGSSPVFESLETQPFNSVFKYSVAQLKDVGTIVIGAYEFLPLNDKNKQDKIFKDYSKKGFRTLAVAFSKKPFKNGKIPNDIQLLGIIVIQDHIRDNAKEIIKWFQDNNVDIKVISGDNELTVGEISRAVEINNSSTPISLEGKSEEEIKELVKTHNVFGRVSPEQKEMIVNALKEKGHVVGMFGDGINDLLGLRSANVSISINNAAKAAKDMSSLILVDNDFKQLTYAVGQGRRVINNLQRTCSLFLTKTFFSIILNIFFLIFGTSMFFGSGQTNLQLWPFFPNTFYAWEMITIGICSFLLALEPNGEKIKGSFITNIIKKALPNGVIVSLVVMGYYLFANFSGFCLDSDINRTIITYVISFASIFILFQVCYSFNLYRLIVFMSSIVLITLMFIFSIYAVGGLNILELVPADAPRFLEAKYNIAIVILIAISSVLMVGVFFFNRYRHKLELNGKEN